MKHNVLTSLLVGLLTVVGVNRSWAEYQPVVNTTANPAYFMKDFTFNKTLIGGIQGYFMDNNQCADGSTRNLSAKTPVTIKFAQAFEYTDASLGYNKKKFDLYVKITSNIQITANSSHKWQANTSSAGYVSINTHAGYSNDFEFEAWVQEGSRNATEVQFIAGNCYVANEEYIKIYGDRNEVYSNNSAGAVSYESSGTYNGYWHGSNNANYPDRYLISSGYSNDHHVKMAYRNTGSGTAEFVIGYLGFSISINKPSGGTTTITSRMNDTIKLTDIDTIKGWEVVEGPVWLVNDSCIPTGGGITKNYRDSIRATGKITLKGYSPYNITFAPNLTGATVSPTTKKVEYGDYYGTFPVPYRDGWLPTGWFTATSGGNKIVADSIVFKKAAHTLYAQWVQGAIVTFKVNGGDALAKDTIHVLYNTPYGTLPTPSRTAYTFAGWYTEPSGGTIVVASDIMKREENHDLYAHWETIKYQVTFINTTGTVSKESMEVTYDAAYGELATATHTTPIDYINRGWNTQADGQGTTITAESIVKTAQDHNLYAQWEQKSDTVTLHLNYDVADTVFGTFIGKWGNTYNDTRLDNYTSSPSRTGWKCVGWFTQKEGGTQVYSTTEVARQNRITLYAHWELKTMNVSFNPRGGSSCDPKQVTYSQQYGPLPTPTMTNYTFLGWLNGVTYGDTIKSTTIVTKENNHYLYAQWSGSTTVYLNAMGGTCSSQSIQVVYNGKYSSLPSPMKTGYNFQNWRLDSPTGSIITYYSDVVRPEDHTLYATWQANTYQVDFKPQGGQYVPGGVTWYMARYDATYGSCVPGGQVHWPVVTQSGKDFIGWYTAAEGGTLVTVDTIMRRAHNHYLYAHWRDRQVTDGTGMDSTSAKNMVNDSLTSWCNKSSGSNVISLSIVRTIYKDGYFNTLCLPFDLTADQIAATFGGAPKELKKYLNAFVQGSGDDREIIIETKDTTGIKAGEAYLISFENGETLTKLDFINVKVTTQSPIAQSGELFYQGVLAPVVLPYMNENYLFLGEENRLYWPKNDGTFLRGFRAYFKVTGGTVKGAPVKRGMKASFGKTVPTANDNVNVNDNNEIKKLIEDGRVVIKTNGVKYDMNGKRL